MHETVAAVVVTYNRKELLAECLDGLLRQTRPVDALFIVDNASTDGTTEYLKERAFIPNVPDTKSESAEIHSFLFSKTDGGEKIDVFYLRTPQNTGGAGGFYEGVKRSYEMGYDWLWLMDDDAEAESDALEILLKFHGVDDLSALAGLKISPENRVLTRHRGYFQFDDFFPRIVRPIQLADIEGKEILEIDHASFVGILISRKAIEKVGYPKKEFFIHYDDVEFCARLRSVGNILLVPGSRIIHKEPENIDRVMKRLLWIPYEIVPFEKLWIRYYHARNLVWLKRKYSTKKVKFYVGLLVYLAGGIAGVLFFQDHKLKRLKFLINRCVDGLTGSFDNRKPRRILYDE